MLEALSVRSVIQHHRGQSSGIPEIQHCQVQSLWGPETQYHGARDFITTRCNCSLTTFRTSIPAFPLRILTTDRPTVHHPKKYLARCASNKTKGRRAYNKVKGARIKRIGVGVTTPLITGYVTYSY